MDGVCRGGRAFFVVLGDRGRNVQRPSDPTGNYRESLCL